MKSEILLETERLILRRMTPNDFDALCGILKDPEVMYAYEGAFDDDMVRAWLENQMKRYEEPGMGLNAVILKETGGCIGQCGLTRQSTPDGTVGTRPRRGSAAAGTLLKNSVSTRFSR